MNTPLLKIQDVSLQLPNVEKPILSSINYQLYPSDFVIVLGSNGSGKSSLLKLLDRRYQATQGDIFLSDQLLANIPKKLFFQQVKTLTQNCHESLFTTLTVFENYLLIKRQAEGIIPKRNQQTDREFLANYLRTFNVNLPAKLDQISGQLSGGEKQTLALALTVLYPPKILLLDEHTSALDPKSAENVMYLTRKVITDHQITCLLTTHDLTVAETYGNRILSLKHGNIYQTIEANAKLTTKSEMLLASCY